MLPEIAEVLVDLGNFPDAERFLDEAAAAAHEIRDARLAAEARLIRLLLELRAGADERWSDVAVPAIEEAIEIFTAESDDAGLAKAWRLLAYVHGTACQYGDAAAACERALEHARRAGDSREERVNATSYALAACWGSTQAEEAIVRCREVIELVADSRLSRGGVTCILGYLHAMRGEFDVARDLCREGRIAIGEIHASWHAAWGSMFAARIEMLAGDPGSAERELRRASDLLEQMGEHYLRSTVIALLARAVSAQGRLDEAYELTELAEELAGVDDVDAQASWRSIRAGILARKRKPDGAERLAQEALQLLLDTDSAVMKVEALAELAEVYALLGGDARWALEEARALADRKGNLAAVAELDDLAGRLEAQPARAS
jgi:ATP/maltotriose-dependent transcriptional regulator MalT